MMIDAEMVPTNKHAAIYNPGDENQGAISAHTTPPRINTMPDRILRNFILFPKCVERIFVLVWNITGTGITLALFFVFGSKYMSNKLKRTGRYSLK